jgi:hypothetical protein
MIYADILVDYQRIFINLGLTIALSVVIIHLSW